MSDICWLEASQLCSASRSASLALSHSSFARRALAMPKRRKNYHEEDLAPTQEFDLECCSPYPLLAIIFSGITSFFNWNYLCFKRN